MAEDAVILLSSDESDAFVTPHKEPSSRRPGAGNDDDVDDDVDVVDVVDDVDDDDIDDDDDDDGFPVLRLKSRKSIAGAVQAPTAAVQAPTAAVQAPTAVKAPAAVPPDVDDDDVLVIDDIDDIGDPPHVSRRTTAAFPASSDDTQSSPFPGPPLRRQPPESESGWDMEPPLPKRPRLSPRPGSPVARATALVPSPQPRKAQPSTECIDLLSSSDDETGKAPPPPPPQKAVSSEPDFVDISELITKPLPRTKTVVPSDKQEHDEILLLSSSPPVRPPPVRPPPVARETSLPTQAAPGRKTIKRSFSESNVFSFDDDDDDDDLAGLGGVDDLLAAWRTDAPKTAKTASTASKASKAAAAPKAAPGKATTTAPKAPPPPPKTTTGTDADKETRAREREAARDEKRRAKEAEREQRQREKQVEKERRKIAADLAREQKARERAEAARFNDANRSRVDKAVAAPEMIVRLPTGLPQATRETAEGLLREIKATPESWTGPQLLPVLPSLPSLPDSVVTWRRRVTAKYQADAGHWEPVPERIEDERHAMAVLRADELVQLVRGVARHATGGGGSYDLMGHARAMRRAFPRHTLIYLVEGLPAWRSKNRTIRNRQFGQAVRAGGAGSAVSPASAAAAAALARTQQADNPAERPSHRLGRRGQKAPPQHLDEAVVDDALLELQMGFDAEEEEEEAAERDDNDDDYSSLPPKIMIHETQTSLDTARWIRIFTEQIAIGRYRRQREEAYASAAASFCMDSGQIATGDGASETFVLMLQQVARVTEPVALGVAARFGSLPRLVRGFRDQGPLALADCLKSRNRNGALSDRTVGPALSRRIYKVVMGKDEASTDV